MCPRTFLHEGHVGHHHKDDRKDHENFHNGEKKKSKHTFSLRQKVSVKVTKAVSRQHTTSGLGNVFIPQTAIRN
jgi:hypothetical protein